MPDQITREQYRDCLAAGIYVISMRNLNTLPCYWGVLREDLKEEWRKKVDVAVTNWLNFETKAAERRKDCDPTAYLRD